MMCCYDHFAAFIAWALHGKRMPGRRFGCDGRDVRQIRFEHFCTRGTHGSVLVLEAGDEASGESPWGSKVHPMSP
jgi:hypothetical protein